MSKQFIHLYVPIIVCCGILLSGCCPQVTPWNFPGTSKNYWEQNRSIKLIAPNGWNDFVFGETVAIAIENSGELPILYSESKGNWQYIWDGSQWVEVKNKYEKMNPRNFVIMPNNDELPDTGVALFDPIIELQEKEACMLFIVQVEIVDGGKGNQGVASGYLTLRLTNDK